MQNKILAHKVAVVTGGGSGIGKSIALLFAQSGGIVHILDLDDTRLQQLEKTIQTIKGCIHLHKCDVSDMDQVNTTVHAIIKKSKAIHILVNNAGIAHVGSLEDTTDKDFQRVFDVNVKGVFFCTKAVIPYMVANKGGVILNMASVAASVALPDRFAYSMSKAAVLNMTLTIARDYIDKNIRCNAISPGRVHTPFVDAYLKKNYPGREKEIFQKLSQTQPIGRMGRPKEIAELALFLCAAKGAEFITGTDYPIDGGFIKLNT